MQPLHHRRLSDFRFQEISPRRGGWFFEPPHRTKQQRGDPNLRGAPHDRLALRFIRNGLFA